MRRVLYSLMAAGLVGLFAGCCHTHGVCDCDVDDYCYTRQPWIHHPPIPAALPGHSVAVPTHLAPAPRPVTEEKTRTNPKELPPPGME